MQPLRSTLRRPRNKNSLSWRLRPRCSRIQRVVLKTAMMRDQMGRTGMMQLS